MVQVGAWEATVEQEERWWNLPAIFPQVEVRWLAYQLVLTGVSDEQFLRVQREVW